MLTGILYGWVAVIVVGIAIEAFTLNLTAIWFAVAAVFSLIAASLSLTTQAQLIIFVLFSAALLILIRPFCKRFLKTKNEATNADRIIDATAVVTVEVDNEAETGEIKVMGQHWTARAAKDQQISVGSLVRVLSINGVKAIVEPKTDQTTQK